MGLIAQVLWQALPELLHVGAVLVCLAVLLALMGNALFGGRAHSFSTLTGMFLFNKNAICMFVLMSMLLICPPHSLQDAHVSVGTMS